MNNKSRYFSSKINFLNQKYSFKDFNKKYNIPKIKSKRLWISNTSDNYNLLPIKFSKKHLYLNNKTITNENDLKSNINDDSDNYIYSISFEKNQNNNEDIYEKTKMNNEYIKNVINNNYNKLFNFEYDSYDKKILKKKFILKESLIEKDLCDDAFNIDLKNLNEIFEKNSPIKKSKSKNNSFINNNIYKKINNIIEINQIQYIALNTCIRNFISEKIDSLIDDEDIQKIFIKENILNNINEINKEIPINIYLKEFLFLAYLSNNICTKYPQFCIDLFDELKDYYININNILSINTFNEFIFGLKLSFHEIKYNKILMIQKLKENFINNNKKISFVFFILFVIYNKKNLSTSFDKDLLFNILDIINIHIYDEINIEQFIKFKIFLVKNKWINNEMK